MSYAIRIVKAHDLWYATRRSSMGPSHETRCDLSTGIDARPNHVQPRARATPGGRAGRLAGGEGLQRSRHQGAKGRNGRPAFDALCRDATKRQFDVVMAWNVDRLGRSLKD